MYYVDYIKHCITTPDTYHRRFERDLPEEESYAKRIALVALPFISLYRPAGAVISIGMGSVRVFSHLLDLNPLQTALAILSLGSSIFNYSLGMVITTGIDTIKDIYHLEFLQSAANVFYLAFMVTGVLEYMMLFAVVQVVVSVAQAKGEIEAGRCIEAGSKMIMTFIRIGQATQYCLEIQKQRELYAKFKALCDRAYRGRTVRALIENPLREMGEGHHHAYGKQIVKGENIRFRKRDEMSELDFKVNHVFRDKIEKIVGEFKGMDGADVKAILHFAGSHARDVKVSDLPDVYKVHLVGLGTIMVGRDAEKPNLYDKVVVQLPQEATLFDLHELVAFMGLEDVIGVSTAEDIERLKLGHLYRIFFPRDATPLERTEEFFTLPVADLKAKMFAKTPEMKEVYDLYFHRMKAEEIFPGKVRYRVVGLRDKAYELGARALTTSVTGSWKDEEVFERVVGVLTKGMLSTEVRHDEGVSTHGLSPNFDMLTGGADSVFTQMFVEHDIGREFDDFAYDNKVRFIIKLDAIELGTYQYLDDSYGIRKMDSEYATRPGILEFIKERQASAWWHPSHEVMLKERLPPSFIQRIVVADQTTHDGLVEYLNSHHVKVADNLIHVGRTLTSAML